MVRATPLLAASSFVLLSGEALGLSSTKFGTRRSSIISPMRSTGLASKFTKKRKATVTDRHSWQSDTRLTSTYVEAKHVCRRPWWLPGLYREASPLQRVSEMLRRKGSRRLVISVILAAIVVFAPAFSPARAASTAQAMAANNVLSPAIMPPSVQSRALGTFNFIPTKAELELCFRLLYAACSGAFVGLERSSSDRPAGVRTMALVGLGACTYSICSTHGFIPHSALGHAPGSPMLANVKCDISRMAANIASGVGFIGAGAIHKSKLHGNGTEAQNVVAGLTTAAAIWVSAAVGIASAVGLYFVGAVATFSTVAILKYARLPKEEDEPGFSWGPRPLDVVQDHEETRPRRSPQEYASSPAKQDTVSGLFGKHVLSGYDPHQDAFVDHDVYENYSKDPHPVIIKEVIDPRFEQYLQSRFRMDAGKGNIVDQREQQLQRESKVSIEEEQEVVSYNVTEIDRNSSFEP